MGTDILLNVINNGNTRRTIEMEEENNFFFVMKNLSDKTVKRNNIYGTIINN